MKCIHCGHEMNQGAKFCARCGKSAGKPKVNKKIILISSIAGGAVLIAALLTVIVLEAGSIKSNKDSIARSNLIKWAEEAKKENLMSYLKITGTATGSKASGTVRNSSADMTIHGYVEVKFMKGKTVAGTASIFLPSSGLKPGESFKYEARSFDLKGSYTSLAYEEGALYAK